MNTKYYHYAIGTKELRRILCQIPRVPRKLISTQSVDAVHKAFGNCVAQQTAVVRLAIDWTWQAGTTDWIFHF